MTGSSGFTLLILAVCEHAVWSKSFPTFLGHEGGVQEEANEAVWFST